MASGAVHKGRLYAAHSNYDEVHRLSTRSGRDRGPIQTMVTVSLLWIYVGCRASARALGLVQAVLPTADQRN